MRFESYLFRCMWMPVLAKVCCFALRQCLHEAFGHEAALGLMRHRFSCCIAKSRGVRTPQMLCTGYPPASPRQVVAVPRGAGRVHEGALCSAATKDCRLTHRSNLDYRKTFLEIIFQRLIDPKIILKEFNLTTCKERREAYSSSRKDEVKSHKLKLDKNYGTIPMPTFATKPLTTSSTSLR